MANFAQIVEVEYRWPDESSNETKTGNVVYTNMTSEEEACRTLGIDDDEVLIYTDNMDSEYIAANFDGLIIENKKEVLK